MVQGIIKKLEIENKEISDPSSLNNNIIDFVKSFLRRLCKSHYLNLIQINNFFGNIILFVLTQEKKGECEMEIFEKEVIDALQKFNNNRSSGNNCLTKQF